MCLCARARARVCVGVSVCCGGVGGGGGGGAALLLWLILPFERWMDQAALMVASSYQNLQKQVAYAPGAGDFNFDNQQSEGDSPLVAVC